MEEILNDVNASQVANVEPQTEQAETNLEAVNADNGEVTTPQAETKHVQTAEDNAKYAQIRREAESKAAAKAKDEMIAEMYGKSHGIYTYADYQKAIAEAEEQARREELAEKGIDPSLIDEYVSNNPTVKWAKELQQKQQQEQKKKEEYAEFLSYFEKENNREFNPKTDTIPDEVWEMTTKGKTLTDAYTYHYANQLKSKVAEYESKLKAVATNQENAESTPGSVTGNGNAKGVTLTPEMIENMSPNELSKRWREVKQVLGMK